MSSKPSNQTDEKPIVENYNTNDVSPSDTSNLNEGRILQEQKMSLYCDSCKTETATTDLLRLKQCVPSHCGSCGRPFKQREIWHIQSYREPQIDMKEQKEDQSMVCPRKFESKLDFLKHHKLSKCVKGPKVFAEFADLKRHNNGKDREGSKRFQCSQCTMNFRLRHSLKRHIQNQHSEDISKNDTAILAGDTPDLPSTLGRTKDTKKKSLHHESVMTDLATTSRVDRIEQHVETDSKHDSWTKNFDIIEVDTTNTEVECKENHHSQTSMKNHDIATIPWGRPVLQATLGVTKDAEETSSIHEPVRIDKTSTSEGDQFKRQAKTDPKTANSREKAVIFDKTNTAGPGGVEQFTKNMTDDTEPPVMVDLTGDHIKTNQENGDVIMVDLPSHSEANLIDSVIKNLTNENAKSNQENYSSVQNSTDPAEKQSQGAIPCTYCPRRLKDKFSLANHIKKQHGNFVLPLLHPCKYCSMMFEKKKMLDKHITSYHYKIRPFNCKECQKTFSDASNLDFHIKIRHPKGHVGGNEAFKCTHCQKTFDQSTDLILHIKIHHGQEGQFECRRCLKKFDRRVFLDNHIRLLHESVLSVR